MDRRGRIGRHADMREENRPESHLESAARKASGDRTCTVKRGIGHGKSLRSTRRRLLSVTHPRSTKQPFFDFADRQLYVVVRYFCLDRRMQMADRGSAQHAQRTRRGNEDDTFGSSPEGDAP